VRPKNGVGYGIAYSNTLSVLCDDIPNSSPALTLTLTNPRNITISWDPLTDNTKNGRDIPFFYLV
jgi:hypothetical protein